MIPDKIGRYEIRAELGRGGMATVYYAHDPRFKRDVAVKVLPSELLHNPTFRARFEREAQTIASLEHPAIVPVYDFGEDAGQPYLVMRFMPGGSLDGRLNRGTLSLAEAARLFARLAPALDEAHARGVIHRDLKPGNILFDQRGDPYISDFGLAKLSEASTTFTGSYLVGTPAYMSPEQARGEPGLDGRSDIYALGAIVFEVLTGQHPYIADTPMGQVVKHITEPVPSILKVKPGLPLACEAVILRAMAKRPQSRFATAVEFAAALEQVANSTADPLAPADEGTLLFPREPHPSLPTPSVERRRSRPLWGRIAAGFVALSLLGSCLVSALPGFARPPATPTSTPTSPAPTEALPSAMPLGVTPMPTPTRTSAPTATSQQIIGLTLSHMPGTTPSATAGKAAATSRTSAPAATATRTVPIHTQPPAATTPAPGATSAPTTVASPTKTPLPSPTRTATPTNPPPPTATKTPVPPTYTYTPVPTTQVPPPTPTQDTQPPSLSNFGANPTTVGALSGCTVTFSADLNDPSGISTASVEWQASGGGGSGSASMSGQTGGGTWSGSAAVSVPLLGHVNWSVTASETFGNSNSQNSGVTINAVAPC